MNKIKQTLLASSLAGLMITLPSLPFHSISLSSSVAHAAGKIPIAVIDFQAKGDVSDDEASIISDRIRTQMFRSGNYHIMERADMLNILKEQGFQQTQVNCDGTNCSVELGKLLAVKQIMTGSVSKLGSIYTLTFRIVDVEKGEIVKDEYQDCRCSLEEVLTRLTVEMVAALNGGGASTSQPVSRPTPQPIRSTAPVRPQIPANTALDEIAKLPLDARQAYYQQNSKAPVLASALNIFLPLPFGYGYINDWNAFWTMTWWELGVLGVSSLIVASAPYDSSAQGLAGLGYLTYAGIAIFTWFDVWGKADDHNKNLRQQLRLAQERSLQQGLSYGSATPTAPVVPLFQQQFSF